MPRIETPDWTHKSPQWVIFDIDGTLADITHRLHHIKDTETPDWNAFNYECYKDDPKSDIIKMLEMCRYYGKQIAIMTGREEIFRLRTEEWLRDKGIKYDLLLMRAAKDYRSDSVIKEELFHNYLKAKDVWFVVDDRQKVVDMWRNLGLTCLQCQKGDY